MILRRVPDEIRFGAVHPDAKLATCRLCSAVIPDDDEGANRAEHEAWHKNVIETLRALIDGKAEAPA